eukprot:CAMPEP_0183295146 /NCGR_PEP_ID=MMETSP0160_2-20130417/3211_1 /TAXON_ID=2839 ORGANISM="Odontella Sinensis, Strain Grunow 1884" /NCGR_SAMPLE_ID=MMETSP0160_2 /ASSEMBLY_ACC=CAM_ASM_000250 /LENGTH=131 /DNA_ID=CAMNT_0025456579 /DNA_START=170 /DNA_END=565 /DNA_ORIENTATION=-
MTVYGITLLSAVLLASAHGHLRDNKEAHKVRRQLPPSHSVPHCCSFDYKHCHDGEWCGKNEENCNDCNGHWIYRETHHGCKNKAALWEYCGDDENGEQVPCCGDDLYCDKTESKWWWTCKVVPDDRKLQEE